MSMRAFYTRNRVFLIVDGNIAGDTVGSIDKSNMGFTYWTPAWK